MKRKIIIGLALVLACCSVALALGGGGGSTGGGGGASVTGTAPQIAGTWHGHVSTPVVQSAQGVMILSEDASGNLTGNLNFGPSFQVLPLVGRARNDGTFQLKTETMIMNGLIQSTTTCIDGSTGEVIGGSVQVRNGVGSFRFDNCPSR